MQIAVIHIDKHVNKLSKTKYVYLMDLCYQLKQTNMPLTVLHEQIVKEEVYLSTGSMLSVVCSTTTTFHCLPSYVCNSITNIFTRMFFLTPVEGRRWWSKRRRKSNIASCVIMNFFSNNILPIWWISSWIIYLRSHLMYQTTVISPMLQRFQWTPDHLVVAESGRLWKKQCPLQPVSAGVAGHWDG